ncbi:MAG: hypothetical protein ACT4QC_08225 [Planctomycetaceae bacterium]
MNAEELFLLSLAVSSSIWVYFDARAIGTRKGRVKGFFDLSPGGWFAFCLLLWIVAFPAYILKRDDLRVAAQLDPPPARCYDCGHSVYRMASCCPNCGSAVAA